MIDSDAAPRKPAAKLRLLPPPARIASSVPDSDAVHAPPLVPILGPRDRITPEVEWALTAVAVDAKAGDRAARDALFLALEAKIARIVAREVMRRPLGGLLRDGRLWDAEDLNQEAYFMLLDLLAEWPSDRPVAGFLFAYLPWRLRDYRRRLAMPHRAETGFEVARWESLHDGTADAEAALACLEAMAEDLAPLDGAILLAIVRDGYGFGAIARRLGVDRRTVRRRWQSLLIDLRASLT